MGFKTLPKIIFGGVHKGFSPPGTKEGTSPEKSTNYELGTRWQKRRLSGQAVLFFNDYDNLLGSDLAAAGGSGSADLFNGGEVQTKGLEFQVSYDLLSNKKEGRGTCGGAAACRFAARAAEGFYGRGEGEVLRGVFLCKSAIESYICINKRHVYTKKPQQPTIEAEG